jgi:hypothetical protein
MDDYNEAETKLAMGSSLDITVDFEITDVYEASLFISLVIFFPVDSFDTATSFVERVNSIDSLEVEGLGSATVEASDPVLLSPILNSSPMIVSVIAFATMVLLV